MRGADVTGNQNQDSRISGFPDDVLAVFQQKWQCLPLASTREWHRGTSTWCSLHVWAEQVISVW